MRKRFIGGNWKMHGTRAEAHTLIDELVYGFQADSDVEVVLFPPYVFLQAAEELLATSAIELGGQNVSAEEKGAFTGEISASMLSEFGCRYVLIGHSERRQLFEETNAIVAKKFFRAYQAGILPVLCVGETADERNAGRAEAVIQQQLEPMLQRAEAILALNYAVIAYEPVWAIGTGVNATPEQAQSMHAFIRTLVGEQDKTVSNHVRIIYGGSVKASNAEALFQMPDIDGGLIGGASLKAQEFLSIIEAVES